MLSDLLYIFRQLAIYAILAGMLMGLPLYAWTLAEFANAAKAIVIAQKNTELAAVPEMLNDKGKLSRPIKGKIRRRK